ncbi:MAG: lactonase family protein [Puia sp.]|nr:lactonase family protein [Puia sp.]
MFIGTYTNKGDSKGIYVYRFNTSTGNAEPVSTIMSDNPSYLAIAPGGRLLYAANEAGGSNGGVSAFSFDKATGQLQFLNKQPGGGNGPCYVSVDAHMKYVLLANYGGGSLSVLPLHEDGSVGPLSQFIQHTGQGGTADKPEKPHVHSATFSPDNKYVYVADLGLDKISIYDFNGSLPQPLSPASPDSSSKLQPGNGPRHMSFHPTRPFVYLIEEKGGFVDAYRYKKSQLTPIQRISSHPQGYSGVIGSADIHVSPDGKFLYASNRGDANSIAVYTINQADGLLKLQGIDSVLGKTPRNFVIDPTSHFLLAANQNSDNVVIFKIDQTTGLLTPTGKELQIPSPVCLKIMP